MDIISYLHEIFNKQKSELSIIFMSTGLYCFSGFQQFTPVKTGAGMTLC